MERKVQTKMNFELNNPSQNQSCAESDFGIELDKISNFQELFNSIHKFKLKSNWNFIKNDHEVTIYKISSNNNQPIKINVVVKINSHLKLAVWVEEVAIDVQDSIWKLLESIKNKNPEKENMVLIQVDCDLQDKCESPKVEQTYDEEWLLDEEDGEDLEYQEGVDVYEEVQEKPGLKIIPEISEKIELPNSASRETVDKNNKSGLAVKYPNNSPNSEGQYECPNCAKSYPNRRTLNKHLYRVHSPATEKCHICGKVFNPYKLQCHMHFHKLQHKCDQCEKSFPHPSSLAAHVKKQHSSTPVNHTCPICNLDLAAKKLLTTHLFELHGYVEESGNKTHIVCEYCGRQYLSKSSIINHFRRGCDQNPHSIKSENLKCRICKIEVKSSSEMTNHMRNHTTKYVCEFCKARFTHKVHYQRHMEKHKDQPRPYQCHTCGASYSRIEHVKSHIARAHTKEFKKKCQYCDKGFITISELKDHERIHTNERPFACTVSGCENTYRTKSALRNHLLRHTNYYYPCKYCYKKFRNMSNLVKHCKTIHQDSYKSDDELEFIPIVSNKDDTTPSSVKDEYVELVFVSQAESEQT
uniref:CSON002594 protein n=1 Tax=Culicoides sonorensis TaxID=179676 RepID=A0A336MLT9_CULSO